MALLGGPLNFNVRSHGASTVVTIQHALVVVLLGVVASSGTAQAPMSGAEAVREIDWNALTGSAPIPEQMPARQSDDPVEAGFARQWIEHALVAPYSDSSKVALEMKVALEIVSKHRDPDDQWAYGMEKELREIVRTKVPKPINVRVFCNSVGCLCYVEQDVALLDRPIVAPELFRQDAHRFGLKRNDVDVLVHAVKPGTPWELTIVRRARPGTPNG